MKHRESEPTPQPFFITVSGQEYKLCRLANPESNGSTYFFIRSDAEVPGEAKLASLPPNLKVETNRGFPVITVKPR